jgi:hypothetical protein
MLSVLTLPHAGPYGSDLTGGWITGGPAGNLKMTMPTAFTTSLLAWGLLSFPDGYAQSNATANTMQQVKCAAGSSAVEGITACVLATRPAHDLQHGLCPGILARVGSDGCSKELHVLCGGKVRRNVGCQNRWGADYLLKTITYNSVGNITGQIYQVASCSSACLALPFRPPCISHECRQEAPVLARPIHVK